ncbi:MAG: S8 family serine peptidase [Anaerolineae bacterium]
MSHRAPLAVLTAMILGGSLLLAPVLAAPRVLPQPPPASGAAPAAVDPALKQAGHPGRQPVIVLLRPSRPDRTALGRSATDAARGRSAFIHRAGPLLSFLGEETAAGRAGPSRALWSVDGIAVDVSDATLRALAQRPEVRAVIADGKLRLEPSSAPQPAARILGVATDPLQWNLRLIKVDEARRLLGVDGSGVTVAVVDSGVDYHHPLLQPSYRGTQPGGSPRHARNWWCNRIIDAFCGLGDTYPVDSVGHGSHVLGTIVAPAGIGVAPGARWIAARACQVDGCPLSWMVAALEWVVDLGEDRPDIVNLSLGTDAPLEIGVYQQAVNRIVEAGIFVVAAMGNNPDSLLAPATFTSTLGVGAVTADGAVWNRSARGISTWQETKPDLVAPGVGITSTLPGGGLGRLSGTSMAAPHVAGVAALVLQARPGLKPAALKDLLRRSATPIGAGLPGRASGWGLVNAYAAVASVSDVGQLRGQVLRSADDEPIVWARITVASPIGDPMASTIVSPSDGSFALDLHPGSYVILAEAFGFRSRSQRDVRISTGQTTRVTLSLDFDEPMGILEGRLLDAASGAPLDGAIRLADVPFTIDSSATFGFSQRLPERSYDLRVERFGYRVLTDTVKISAAAPSTRIYRLQRAPRILLVDGDAWIYSGAVDLYRAALDRMGYLYDVHSVSDDFAGPGKPGGPPTTATMARYDLVIWASPLSSPNKVMGAYELGGYLAGGGRLIVSGQDLLCQDSGREVPGKPCNENGPVLPYVRDQLLVKVVADTAIGATQLSGVAGGPLADLRFTLNDPGGLQNQSSPDALALRDEARGRLILRYGGGQGAAALVDTCTGYRAAVLGFGLEGIGDTAARARLLDRVIQALMAPAPAAGLHAAVSQSRLVEAAGGSADYRLTVLNTGALAAAYTVTLAAGSWPAELRQADFGAVSDGRLRLASCETAVLGLRVRIPADSAHGSSARTEILIQGADGGDPRRVAVETRTPAPLLVVDGDYGSDSEQRYLEALDALGLPYDQLELGLLQLRPSLPPTRTLRSYPMVLWFTGYSGLKMDRHFGPEIQRLMADYLDAGGRLLLSSEDYLYHWAATPYRDALLFHRERLGVEAFEESAGQAHQGPLVGADKSIYQDLPPGCRLASRPQAEDFSDRLILRQVPLARAAIFNQLGEAVAAQYEQNAGYKTVFLAFDAATLAPSCAERVIGNALDWFNPWTSSALEQVDAAGRVLPPGTYRGGDRLRLRLRLSHTGPAAEAPVAVRWTLPRGATLEASPPLPPGWILDGTDLRWSGTLPRFQEQTLQVNLRLDPDLPRALEQVSEVAIASDNQTLRRRTLWRVNAPDLRSSSKSVPDDQRMVRPGQTVKFIINLANTGTEPSGRFVLTDTLPAGLELLPERILAESGTVRLAGTNRLVWEGTGLLVGSSSSLVYSAQVASHRGGWLANRAELHESGLPSWWLEARVFVRPELIFPWLGREPEPDP